MQHLKADWPFYNIILDYIYNKRYTFYCITQIAQKTKTFINQHNSRVVPIKTTPLLYFLIV